jgi:hypothetical protein
MHHVRRPVHAIAVLAASAALILAVAQPAAAQHRRASDPRGDAPASADVTRVVVRNGAKAVVVVLKVRNLHRRSDVTIYINHDGRGRYGFRTAGTRRGFLSFEGRRFSRSVPCSARRVTRHAGTKSRMVVRLPQRCFGSRAGRAAFTVTMWQAGGQGSDRVASMPLPVRRG